MATGQWAAISGFLSRVKALANPDPAPLLAHWRVEIEADNEYGVLAGQDYRGQPMPAVTYRPKPEPGRKWTAKDERRHKATAHERFQAPLVGGHDDNLTRKQYEQLSGPPLAPRGKSSRVIKSLETGWYYDSAAKAYTVVAAWADVVSAKGVPFLMAHFTGASVGRGHKVKLPVRDLRGIRPRGQERLLRRLQEWLRSL